MLRLTPAGNSQLEAMHSTTRQRIAELLSQLSSEELAQISAGLTLLGQAFQVAK
ncbi:MAG: hypothetical protein IGS54_23035 [Elainella sp. C42_A2020_010]|nr:hypothetical protein [Elainella sp. C42_A2020_010]